MRLRADLLRAVVISWMILSAVAASTVLVSLLLPAESIYGLLPECEAKARGGACPACGLTTGFVLLSRGEFDAARQANAASPFLYFGFVANFAAAAAYLLKTLPRRRITGDPDTCNSSL